MSITLDAIHSNNDFRCARCGEPITEETYTGWEVFVDKGAVTQSICKWCDLIDSPAGRGGKIDG
jgi:hypothetical protein